MSADEFEKRFQHHIEFMLAQQARFDERQAQFVERQVQFDERLNKLEQVQTQQAENINRLIETVAATQSHIDSAIGEMHDGFNKLIAANELTNSLIEKLTMLEVQNSQRLPVVERRVDTLDDKPS
jgi:hypothetical protein